MSELRVNANTPLSVDQRRIRQTPRPAVTFEKVLKGGARALLEGAATATRLVGMPTLSAAISRVNVDSQGSAATALGNTGGASSALDQAQMEQTLHQQRVNDDRGTSSPGRALARCPPVVEMSSKEPMR